MKIDKKNFRHWIYLFIFTFNLLTALLSTLFSRRLENRIVLYGHKLNGNLAAIYYFTLDNIADAYTINFLCLDPVYHKRLKGQGVRTFSALNWFDIRAVCRATFIITDHGPHALFFLNLLRTSIFIDVWHGIPYKFLTNKDLYFVKKYEAIFVPSRKIAEIYVKQFKIPPGNIHITGYGRTDRLIAPEYDKQQLFQNYGISSEHVKNVLYAPTWQHAVGEKGLGGFGIDENEFLNKLTTTCQENDANLIVRSHINMTAFDGDLQNLFFLPSSKFPDTEEILLMSDVLISDWSSIVFDYLLLEKPTIFLERRVPFVNGFAIGPAYRFGLVANDFASLKTAIGAAVTDTRNYMERYSGRMKDIKNEIYGNYSDGRSTARYFEALKNIEAVTN